MPPMPKVAPTNQDTVARSRLRIDRDELARFCRQHHIRKLLLFGSVLRDDVGPDSDVDVLVDVEPGHVPGLALIDIEDELSALFGRRVDLATPKSFSRWIRHEVLADAEVEYAER